MRLLCLAGLVAAPVFAQTAAPAAPVIVTAAKPVKVKPVCRSSQVSGSLMPERTCHSAQEWAEIDAGRAHDIDNAARHLVNINRVQTDHTGSPAFQ